MKSNQIRESVLSRITGERPHAVYQATKDFLRFNDSLSKLAFKITWGIYLRGSRSYDGDRQPELDDFIRSFVRNGNVLDFGLFKLPVVAENYWPIFRYEFVDLVGPYLMPNRCFPWPANEGKYEKFGVRVLPQDVVVDVGANLGVFSAFAASKGAEVYAFEPYPLAQQYLKLTLDLNQQLRGSIKLVSLALMDKCSRIPMQAHVGANISTASVVIQNDAASAIEVESSTLDAWAEQNGIRKISFIKADIEGAERFLLRGAVQTLARLKPRLAICTYHSPEDPELLEEIIKQANPSYQVRHTEKKLFAW